MERELYKVDKNGTKYYRVFGATCPRCGGAGKSSAWANTGYTCFECGGAGIVDTIEKEYSKEYIEKLEARRAKRNATVKEARERVDEEKRKKEAEVEAIKAKSSFFGNVGEKIEREVTFVSRASFRVPSFRGYGEDVVVVYNFKDGAGNVFVWKTTSGSLGCDSGDVVTIKATIKSHEEYKGIKQTTLSRVKVI